MASAAALDVVQAFPGPVFLKHVDLDAEATLPYTPDPIGYTDCVEISLLRFVTMQQPPMPNTMPWLPLALTRTVPSLATTTAHPA